MRNSIKALFFLAGMAFMATLVFMVQPDLLSNQPVRVKPGPPYVIAGSPGEAEAPAEPNVADKALPKDQTLVIEKHFAAAPPERNETILSPVAIQEPPPIHPIVSASKEQVRQFPIQSRRRGHFAQLVGIVNPGRTVFGHVKLIGKPPDEKKVDVVCGHDRLTIKSRIFVTDEEGSLADVVVTVSQGLRSRSWPPVREKAIISVRKCQFEPYVTVVQAGQQVLFENLGSELHNLAFKPERNRSKNIVMHHGTKRLALSFDQPEDFIRFDCGVMPWMVAYVSVVDHPYFAVTKSDGLFHIPNLPAGEYTIKAHHRKIGFVEERVVVKEDESPQIEFEFVLPTELADARRISSRVWPCGRGGGRGRERCRR